jgi:hypothetical protein
MGVIDITSLQQLKSLGGIIAVYFWADWNKPCGQLSEIYAKLSDQHPHLPIAKVEAEKVPEVSELYSIEAVPYLLFLKVCDSQSREYYPKPSTQVLHRMVLLLTMSMASTLQKS